MGHLGLCATMVAASVVLTAVMASISAATSVMNFHAVCWLLLHLAFCDLIVVVTLYFFSDGVDVSMFCSQVYQQFL